MSLKKSDKMYQNLVSSRNTTNPNSLWFLSIPVLLGFLLRAYQGIKNAALALLFVGSNPAAQPAVVSLAELTYYCAHAVTR